MTTDSIQEAREIIAKCLNEYKGEIPQIEIYRGFSRLPALITEVERWQAMAIEERAHRVAYENNVPLSEYRDRAMCDAARELRAESNSWRKIDLKEKEAIETAIGLMKDCNHFPGEIDYSTADFNEEIAVLKKLLEGMT